MSAQHPHTHHTHTRAHRALRLRPSEDECTHIVELARPVMARARVASEASDSRQDRGRTSSVAWLPDPVGGGGGRVGGSAAGEADPLLVALEQRLAALLGCRPECTEPFQVLHYAAGQQYEPHLDGYDTSSRRGKFHCARG
eukprot:SAG11_NODE_5580_length_1518_cov_1.463002_2_plen_140_part_01